MYKTFYLSIITFILAFYIHNAESFKKIPTLSCPVVSDKPLPYPTPSPININTNETKSVFVRKPIVIRNSIFGALLVRNTGYALEIIGHPASITSSGSYGGVLCGTFYKFHKAQIYFNPDGKSRSYDTIDGVGSPLTVVLIYQNSKYLTFEEALHHRDGLAIEIFRYKLSTKINLLFIPVSLIISLLREPGSAFYVGPDVLAYAWFVVIPLIPGYHVFPGAYYDLETGKSYDCATIIVAEGVYPIMTPLQFKIFSFLKSHNGTSLQTIAPKVHPAGPRQIQSVKGLPKSFVGQYVII